MGWARADNQPEKFSPTIQDLSPTYATPSTLLVEASSVEILPLRPRHGLFEKKQEVKANLAATTVQQENVVQKMQETVVQKVDAETATQKKNKVVEAEFATAAQKVIETNTAEQAQAVEQKAATY